MFNRNIWIFNQCEVKPDILKGTRYSDFGKELVKRRFMVKYLGEDTKWISYLLTHYAEVPQYGMEYRPYYLARKFWGKTPSYKGNNIGIVVNFLSIDDIAKSMEFL